MKPYAKQIIFISILNVCVCVCVLGVCVLGVCVCISVLELFAQN